MRGEFNKQLYHCSIWYFSSVASVCGFPAEFGYFYTVATEGGGFDPLETKWVVIGLVFSTNWGGFVMKTWQPCISAQNQTCSLR